MDTPDGYIQIAMKTMKGQGAVFWHIWIYSDTAIAITTTKSPEHLDVTLWR